LRAVFGPPIPSQAADALTASTAGVTAGGDVMDNGEASI